MMSYILNNAHYTQMLSDLSEGSTDGVDSDDKPSQPHSAVLKTTGHGNSKVTETKKGSTVLVDKDCTDCDNDSRTGAQDKEGISGNRCPESQQGSQTTAGVLNENVRPLQGTLGKHNNNIIVTLHCILVVI